MSWETLVSTALLGTERRPPQPVEGVPELDWSDAEGALLGAAAILATARAAGAAPAAAPEPRPAPEDPTPLCSENADAVLARVLAEHDELLEEWVERATRAGVRAWPRRLPGLLDAATYDRSLRAAALLAGGRPAAWLAAQWPDWSWAAGRGEAPDWETATRAEREAMILADRSAAPRLIASTWDEDTPEDRRAFLEMLEEGISPDDEPLLERALDDRRKPVRLAAARLLGFLPGSARAQRMAARLQPAIALAGTIRKRIEVEPPDAVDAAMARDGVLEKGAPRGMGERAFWLSQIVAGAPLRVWTDELGLAPQRIVELLAGERAVIEGLARAAAMQRDPEWIQSLAEHLDDPSLLSHLPPAAGGAAIRALLARTRTLQDVASVIDATVARWDRETSEAVLAAIERAPLVKDMDWLRLNDLRPLAELLDPSLFGRAAAALAKHDGTGIQPAAAGEVLSILDLRHAIHREIP